jgi:hypothetical protein
VCVCNNACTASAKRLTVCAVCVSRWFIIAKESVSSRIGPNTKSCATLWLRTSSQLLSVAFTYCHLFRSLFLCVRRPKPASSDGKSAASTNPKQKAAPAEAKAHVPRVQMFDVKPLGDNKGKGAVASRALKAGSIVLHETALFAEFNSRTPSSERQALDALALQVLETKNCSDLYLAGTTIKYNMTSSTHFITFVFLFLFCFREAFGNHRRRDACKCQGKGLLREAVVRTASLIHAIFHHFLLSSNSIPLWFVAGQTPKQ